VVIFMESGNSYKNSARTDGCDTLFAHSGPSSAELTPWQEAAPRSENEKYRRDYRFQAQPISSTGAHETAEINTDEVNTLPSLMLNNDMSYINPGPSAAGISQHDIALVFSERVQPDTTHVADSAETDTDIISTGNTLRGNRSSDSGVAPLRTEPALASSILPVQFKITICSTYSQTPSCTIQRNNHSPPVPPILSENSAWGSICATDTTTSNASANRATTADGVSVTYVWQGIRPAHPSSGLPLPEPHWHPHQGPSCHPSLHPQHHPQHHPQQRWPRAVPQPQRPPHTGQCVSRFPANHSAAITSRHRS
jgi:hypothetical protein